MHQSSRFKLVYCGVCRCYTENGTPVYLEKANTCGQQHTPGVQQVIFIERLEARVNRTGRVSDFAEMPLLRAYSEGEGRPPPCMHPLWNI